MTNSESDKTETIQKSNRPVVPVGTTLARSQTRTFTETATTKPSAPLELDLTGYWAASNVTVQLGEHPGGVVLRRMQRQDRDGADGARQDSVVIRVPARNDTLAVGSQLRGGPATAWPTGGGSCVAATV